MQVIIACSSISSVVLVTRRVYFEQKDTTTRRKKKKKGNQLSVVSILWVHFAPSVTQLVAVFEWQGVCFSLSIEFDQQNIREGKMSIFDAKWFHATTRMTRKAVEQKNMHIVSKIKPDYLNSLDAWVVFVQPRRSFVLTLLSHILTWKRKLMLTMLSQSNILQQNHVLL